MPVKYCECGCGEKITSRYAHAFIHGHNGKLKSGSFKAMEGPNPSGLCFCGCGGRAPIAPYNRTIDGKPIAIRDKPMRWCKGHKKKGVTRHKSGYTYVRCNGEYVPEHVLIWEQCNNKAIPKGFVIHHLDCDKANNNISNLILMSASDHTKWHIAETRAALNYYRKAVSEGALSKNHYVNLENLCANESR